jgi:diketogulonate reductase-like aldo/keto reductase
MDEYGVRHESWAPFAEGRQNLFTNETLKRMAEYHKKSVAQVVLRWLFQREIVAIPKSTHKERIIENFDIFDFELSAEDMEAIRAMDEQKALFVVHEDPEFVKQINSRKIHN